MTWRGWLVVAIVIVVLAWVNSTLPSETDGRNLPNTGSVSDYR